MSHPVLHTELCELVGIDVPIVQTGMGWVSGARLTAATANAGGLGILASATMTYEQLAAALAELGEATDRPFGVNIRANQGDVDRVVDLVIRHGVRVASFAQAPGEVLVKRLRDAGVVTMPTVAARRHAEKVAAWGVDAVIAQGHEGGGHTGSVPTSLLASEIARVIDIPVVAAGGFRDGRGLVAALAWGAAGIAMGTRFLLTRESTVPDAIKEHYLGTAVTDTVVTRAIDGLPQRVIRTSLTDGLERRSGPLRLVRALRNAASLRRVTGTSLPDLVREGLSIRTAHELTWAQLAMAANAPMLTRAAMVDGRLDAGILPTGQVVGVIDDLPSVAELIASIVADAEATLERLGAPALASVATSEAVE